MTTVADAVRIAIKAKQVMEKGSPMDWPTICAFWDLAKRVKSGMFRESVAQKPIQPVSEGMNILKNSPVVANFEGRT